MALFFHEKIRENAIWRKRTVSWFMVRCDTQWILLSNLEFFPRVEYSLLKAPHFNPHGIHPEQILFHFICLLLGFTEENWFNPICLPHDPELLCKKEIEKLIAERVIKMLWPTINPLCTKSHASHLFQKRANCEPFNIGLQERQIAKCSILKCDPYYSQLRMLTGQNELHYTFCLISS